MEISFYKLLYKHKILFITIIIICYFFINKNIILNPKSNIYRDGMINFDKNFDYLHFENDFITEKMKNEAGWALKLDHAFFINGLIRKHKPKKCLEIGVANGGSSILILNAIKDYSDSELVSIDLFKYRGSRIIGYLVEQKFPQLMNKWKLFLGDMPHKFLSKLNMKFDFLFLDSAHVSPGEFFNFIEALPFLKENAIVVLHDTMWHLLRAMEIDKKLDEAKVMPTQIYLMSSIIGEKILIKQNLYDFVNIGAVCLAKSQQNYYLNYFLLMMTIWQYMPSDEQINGLRQFIKKYYKNELYLRIFNNSVDYNRKFFLNLKEGKYKLK